jgi:hypothetical protein
VGQSASALLVILLYFSTILLNLGFILASLKVWGFLAKQTRNMSSIREMVVSRQELRKTFPEQEGQVLVSMWPGSRTMGVGTGCVLFVIIMLFMVSYSLELYPKIPQAVGGAKPRCALLDSDKSKLSADSRAALFSRDGGSESTTIRSDEVEVYHAGDTWVLVKKALATEQRDTNTYEINREAINAIVWCDCQNYIPPSAAE